MKNYTKCAECNGSGIEPGTRQACLRCLGSGETCEDVENLGNLIDTIELLQAEVVSLKARVLPRVEFQTQTTDSGIQLTGGPTTITKTGIVMGIVPIQNGAGQSFGALIKEDGQPNIVLVGFGGFKFLDGV